MIKIDEPGALEALAYIEGEAWRARQEADRNSPTGFFAHKEAWDKFERMRRFDPETTRHAAELVEGGDGLIHGEWQMYRLLPSGEIALVRSSCVPTGSVEARVRKTRIRIVD